MCWFPLLGVEASCGFHQVKTEAKQCLLSQALQKQPDIACCAHSYLLAFEKACSSYHATRSNCNHAGARKYYPKDAVQPLLFGAIGIEIDFRQIQGSLIWKTVIILAIGTFFSCTAAPIVCCILWSPSTGSGNVDCIAVLTTQTGHIFELPAWLILKPTITFGQ